MNTQEQQLLQEIADRTRRTETNLHKMREHFGIAGAPNNHVAIVGHNAVRVQGYDVTLSQIRKAITSAPGCQLRDKIQVADVNDQIIAVVTFFD